MTATRIFWGAAGLLALAVGAVGVYFSLRQADQQKPPAATAAAPQSGSLFRTHETPRLVAELGFEDSEGRKRSLSEWRGKVVLLNIWATWCAPCREEMPALDRVQQKLGGPGFEVLALSIDSTGAASVKRFYQETSVRSLAVYVDPTMRATASLAAMGVPTTLLIDADGREIGRRTGPAQWDSPQSLRQIGDYVGRSKKP